jgi:hypothetical protein
VETRTQAENRVKSVLLRGDTHPGGVLLRGDTHPGGENAAKKELEAKAEKLDKKASSTKKSSSPTPSKPKPQKREETSVGPSKP